MNKSDQPNLQIPKIDAELDFPDIGFVLEELQYRNLTVVLERFSLYQRGIRVGLLVTISLFVVQKI
jgi:hypothetical protein